MTRLVLFLLVASIRCQCPANWFGETCSQIDRCSTGLCPDGFRCQTLDQHQECLTSATFLGEQSQIRARFNGSFFDGRLSFRFRLRPQAAHFLTLKNLDAEQSVEIFLRGENFVYRESNSTEELLVAELNNAEWTDFHLRWTNDSTLIVNHRDFHPVNFTVDGESTTFEILLGHGFRGCLDEVLLGTNLYLPFYDPTRYENFTQRLDVELFQRIETNNCSFGNVCQGVRCEHGRCRDEFDRGVCQCDKGWEGLACELNIDECAQGNNCSKEHSVCEDQPDGSYTCKCDLGFTGQLYVIRKSISSRHSSPSPSF